MIDLWFTNNDANKMEMFCAGLLLCVSYGYGFTDRLFGNEEERMWMKSPPPMSGPGWTAGSTWPPNNIFGRLPLVIVPEWPLPMEFFSPEVSTLALLTNAHPFPSSPHDFELKSWEVLSSGNTYGSSSTPYNKMIVRHFGLCRLTIINI